MEAACWWQRLEHEVCSNNPGFDCDRRFGFVDLRPAPACVGKVVEPGQFYEVEEYGNLGDSSLASLVCTYFTGRGLSPKVYWYSAGNLMGRDSCPFLYRP